MTDIQRIVFNLLIEVDDICRRNGITYFLHENTALDAVQGTSITKERCHAEVTMRVPEMLRFMEAFEREKPNGRSLESWLTNPHYSEFGCRYVDESTLYLDLPNSHAYKNYGFAVRISALRDFPASHLKSKVLTARELGFEMTYDEGNKATGRKAAICGSYVKKEIRSAKGLDNFSKKMFEDFCTFYDNDKAERCFTRHFRNRRHHFDRSWFDKPMYAVVEGHRFPLPSNDYFISLYGSRYMTRAIPGRYVTRWVIADTAIPYRKYLEEIKKSGCSLEEYIAQREKYVALQNKGQDKFDTIQHYWDLLFRTGDRFDLYERYAPMKAELVRMHSEERYDELSAALAPYRKLLMKNYGLGLGLCFDPDILDYMIEILRREHKDELADNILKLIPPEHKKPIVIKGYQDE
ncbi:MAG: hypothetical protein IKO27_09295 [Ruminococcus sp.]|nr:hypothetical protein [Ruminococcus sp.]